MDIMFGAYRSFSLPSQLSVFSREAEAANRICFASAVPPRHPVRDSVVFPGRGVGGVPAGNRTCKKVETQVNLAEYGVFYPQDQMKQNMYRDLEDIPFDFHFPDDLSQSSDFVVGPVIGYGVLGSVFSATPRGRPRERMAVKFYPLLKDNHGKHGRQRLQNELKAIRKLDHCNIISNVMSARCPTNLALMMPYFPNGDLFGRLRTVTEFESRLYFFQVCSAVSHMYQHKIAHLDLKLENILLADGGRVVLSDFGFAQVFPSHASTIRDTVGTRVYWAPECGTGDRMDPFKLDVYATGVVLWSLTYRIQPCADVDMLDHLAKHQHIHPLFSWCIRTLMEPNPDRRTTMPEFADHFIHSINTNDALYTTDHSFPVPPSSASASAAAYLGDSAPSKFHPSWGPSFGDYLCPGTTG